MKQFLAAFAAVAGTLIPGSGALAQSAAPAGQAAEGQKKAAMCIGCHGIEGYQASFPEVYKVPRIGGQNAAYIAAALQAYKKGDRRHPTMRSVAESLSDQDMADLAAFYGAQSGALKPAAAPGEPPAVVAELLRKGNCATCHGANLSTPIDPSYPKLAGQYADYLAVALRAYATQGNPVFGRTHAIMGAQVKPFQPAELKALAAYIAALPGEVTTVSQSRFK